MRQRHSFRAIEWESLEGRQLLATAVPVTFPSNLAQILLLFDQKNKPTKIPTPGGTTGGSGGNPQPQVIVAPPPPGFLDGRVALTRNDVAKIDSMVHNFVRDSTAGLNAAQDAAAASTFKAALKSFDAFVSAEQHLPSGSTSSLLTPLLNGVALARFELDNLKFSVDSFSKAEGYKADNTINNPAALNSLESSLNLIIAAHPKPGATK